MGRIVIGLLWFLCAVSASGQIGDRAEIIPLDSTEYYEALFADDTEFDIREFQPLPSRSIYGNDSWRLFDSIKPVPGFEYWECRFSGWEKVGRIGELVTYRGDRWTYGEKASYRVPDSGFFVACSPNICYLYIVAVREDKTSDLIDDEKKLIEFMGDVDNIEEVLLHIQANGYWYDEETMICGAYKEEADRYLLYVSEPWEWSFARRSVKAILYKNGEFEVISKTTYKMDDVMTFS